MKVTTYVGFGSHAVVVAASWCDKIAVVQLKVDWKALGLDPASVRVTQLEVDGVQPAADHGAGAGNFSIGPEANGGVMLFIESRQ